VVVARGGPAGLAAAVYGAATTEALVVIAVWEEYGAVSETVEQEANAAADIYWLAARVPEPPRTGARPILRRRGGP
jgi:hypothetical protein